MEQADLLQPEPPKKPLLISTDQVRMLMRKRYPAPEWAFMEEVAPATGGGRGYADAIAMNLYQSRGHAVHGFEIKTSRSDWLRELKQPDKAEAIFKFCDYWWIVAPRGVVKEGELPPTWGLIDAREATLLTAVAAPKLTAVPLTRGFFASIMRRSHETLEARARSLVRIELDEARRRQQEDIERQVRDRTRQATETEKHVAEFMEATGLPFDRYSGPPIETIKMAQQLEKLGAGWGTHEGPLGKLLELADDLERTSAHAREAVAAIGLRAAK